MDKSKPQPPATFAVEIEPQPQSQKLLGCSYCHRSDGTHSKGCSRRGREKTDCRFCGSRTRHKRGCRQYRGKGREEKGSGGAGRGVVSEGGKTRSKTRRGGGVDAVMAEALIIARERAEEGLEQARGRLVEAQADVRALERLVVGFGEGK